MSPIASFDVNAREALSNPHQAAIDVKKPAGLVPCGLSVLHRTYPDHHLGWRPCVLFRIIMIFIVI
ncbi:hypothetical protein FXO49_21920, partial [Salmonella enterica]|nr:hypothetical protein [Salmonella enterica]